MTALDDALWPRAALPRRPMLGAVLDALTVPNARGRTPSVWVGRPGLHWRIEEQSIACATQADGYPVSASWSLSVVDPAEAYELLQTRGLIPMEYRPHFTCEACGGRGYITTPAFEGPGRERFVCMCDAGHRPHPPTVAALASWASLGFAAGDDDPGILRAEDLATAGWSDAPVVWQVAQPGADVAPVYCSGTAMRALLDAGFGVWRRASHTALIVPPLGLVTP